MLQRIITAIAGLLVMTCFLLFYWTPLINVMVVLVTFSSVYELMTTKKFNENKPLFYSSLAFSIIVPFSPNLMTILLSIYVYLFVIFVILIVFHKSLKAETVGFTFMLTAFITCSMTTIIFLRDTYPKDFILYVLLSLGGGWLADSGAYFIGKAFGKRKLCPEISPKKTIEGVLGGFLGNIIGYLIVTAIYLFFSRPMTVDYFYLIMIAVILTPIGMIGDLTASVIKRQCNIKDFGSILPGHGGMLDRFDSTIFVMPVAYLLFTLFPVIH